jgi:hypothetical protein
MTTASKSSTRDGLTTLLDAVFASVADYRLEEFLGRHPWLASLMAAGYANGGYTREMVEANVPQSFHGTGEHANVADFIGLMEFLSATTAMLKLRLMPVMGGSVVMSVKTLVTPTKLHVQPKKDSISEAIVNVLGDAEQALVKLTELGGFAALRKNLKRQGVKVKYNNLRLIMKRFYGITATSVGRTPVPAAAVTQKAKPKHIVQRSKTKRRYRRKNASAEKGATDGNSKYANSATQRLYAHFGDKAKATLGLPKALKAAGSVQAFLKAAKKWPEMAAATTELSGANVHFILKNITGMRVSEVLGSRK